MAWERVIVVLEDKESWRSTDMPRRQSSLIFWHVDVDAAGAAAVVAVARPRRGAAGRAAGAAAPAAGPWRPRSGRHWRGHHVGVEQVVKHCVCTLFV